MPLEPWSMSLILIHDTTVYWILVVCDLECKILDPTSVRSLKFLDIKKLKINRCMHIPALESFSKVLNIRNNNFLVTEFTTTIVSNPIRCLLNKLVRPNILSSIANNLSKWFNINHNNELTDLRHDPISDVSYHHIHTMIQNIPHSRWLWLLNKGKSYFLNQKRNFYLHCQSVSISWLDNLFPFIKGSDLWSYF